MGGLLKVAVVLLTDYKVKKCLDMLEEVCEALALLTRSTFSIYMCVYI